MSSDSKFKRLGSCSRFALSATDTLSRKVERQCDAVSKNYKSRHCGWSPQLKSVNSPIIISAGTDSLLVSRYTIPE